MQFFTGQTYTGYESPHFVEARYEIGVKLDSCKTNSKK